jgi:hypothetical protein
MAKRRQDRFLTARGVGWLRGCDKGTVVAAVERGELRGSLVYGPDWEPSGLAVKESAARAWRPPPRGPRTKAPSGRP